MPKDQVIAATIDLGGNSFRLLVGTGGTASTLASLDQELPCHEADKINGYFLTILSINEIYSSLAGLSLEQRKDCKGLEAGQEGIIARLGNISRGYCNNWL